MANHLTFLSNLSEPDHAELNEFECPPKLVKLFTDQSSSTDEDHNQTNQEVITTDDKIDGGFTYKASRQFFLSQELVELTCAFELTDQFDLDLSTVEWFQLVAGGEELIWSSAGSTNSPTTTNNKSVKDDRHQQPARYFVIDYVTRTNLSSRDARDADQEEKSSRPMKLIRVAHLVASLATSDGQQQNKRSARNESERNFLCRITNKAGHFDVLHSVSILTDLDDLKAVDLARTQAAIKSRKKFQNLRESKFLESLQQSSALVQHRNGSLDKAKLEVASQLRDSQSPNSTKERLFILLYSSDDLRAVMRSIELNGANLDEMVQPSATESLLGRNVNNNLTNDHQRQATRHLANGTATNSSLAVARIHVQNGDHEDGFQARQRNSNRGQQSWSSLSFVALNLIDRYTSNQLSLIRPSMVALEEAWEDQTQAKKNSTGQPRSTQLIQALWSDNRPFWARLKYLWRLLYAKYLDKWIQLAIGEAPILLGICAGLLVGFLMSLLFILRLSQGNFGRRKKITDSYNEDQPIGTISPNDSSTPSDGEDPRKSADIALISSPALNHSAIMHSGGSSSSTDRTTTTTTTNGSLRELIQPFGKATNLNLSLGPKKSKTKSQDIRLESPCQLSTQDEVAENSYNSSSQAEFNVQDQKEDDFIDYGTQQARRMHNLAAHKSFCDAETRKIPPITSRLVSQDGRLIVVSPSATEQEVHELALPGSASCFELAQQQELVINGANSDSSGPISVAQLDNCLLASQQMAGLNPITGFALPHHYAAGQPRHWLAGCDEPTTADDCSLSSAARLSGGSHFQHHHHHHHHQLQPQQQQFIVDSDGSFFNLTSADPAIAGRASGDAPVCLAGPAYTTYEGPLLANNETYFNNVPNYSNTLGRLDSVTANSHSGSQTLLPRASKRKPLPLKRLAGRLEPSQLAANDKKQPGSSQLSSSINNSPAASTNSSASAQVSSQLLPLYIDRQQQQGRPFENLVYLDDALQLLNVSMKDCLQFQK